MNERGRHSFLTWAHKSTSHHSQHLRFKRKCFMAMYIFVSPEIICKIQCFSFSLFTEFVFMFSVFSHSFRRWHGIEIVANEHSMLVRIFRMLLRPQQFSPYSLHLSLIISFFSLVSFFSISRNKILQMLIFAFILIRYDGVLIYIMFYFSRCSTL